VEFHIGEGSELVEAHLVGLGLISVVLGNNLEILFEDGSSVKVLFGSEHHAVLGLPFLESILAGLLVADIDSCEAQTEH